MVFPQKREEGVLQTPSAFPWSVPDPTHEEVSDGKKKRPSPCGPSGDARCA
jgi:hypothetical protein